jgi:hypothetical protein
LEGVALGALTIAGLAAVAAVSPFAATAAAVALAVLGVAGAVHLVASWRGMSDGQKSEALGNVIGGVAVGGAAGAMRAGASDAAVVTAEGAQALERAVTRSDRIPFESVQVETSNSSSGSAFHYTFSKLLDSISRNGLRQGSYATNSGDLSPLQAQIDLALAPNRGLPDSLVRIDLNGLRNAGFQIPELTRVGRSFGMPGGGYEMQFPYPIPPEFVQVIR